MDHVRQVLRVKHYSLATERGYCQWILRYIRFHGIRHPSSMGAHEVETFLTHLATVDKVAASTQNQALNAMVFLYRDVLKMEVGQFDAVRARRPTRVPVVLTVQEVSQLLGALRELKTTEPYALMAQLMYGAGLRLMECCRLRIKDVDMQRGQLIVRGGKGNKDRYVMLPTASRAELERLLDWRRALHEQDLARGHGRVEMPDALERKLPGADHQLGWQFVSRRASCRTVRARDEWVVTTFIKGRWAGQSLGECVGWGGPSARPATPCATPSPRICSKRVRTFAPCRNCSVTTTSARR